MFPRGHDEVYVNGVTSSFVVLSPQLDIGFGIWPTWYVDQMIQYAKANLQIDTNRIYVCGLVWAAAVCGTMPFLLRQCHEDRPLHAGVRHR